MHELGVPTRPWMIFRTWLLRVDWWYCINVRVNGDRWWVVASHVLAVLRLCMSIMLMLGVMTIGRVVVYWLMIVVRRHLVLERHILVARVVIDMRVMILNVSPWHIRGINHWVLRIALRLLLLNTV